MGRTGRRVRAAGRTSGSRNRLRRLRPAACLLVALALSPVPLSGCSEEWKQRISQQAEQRKREMAERLLKDRALEYWELVRWKAWSQAATYLEQERDQLDYLHARTAIGQQDPAIDDVEIRYVFVGTPGLDDAEIRVSWSEVLPVEARVSARQVAQRWYKHHGQWWVDPEQPLGLADSAGSEDVLEEPPPDLPTETPR